MLFRRLQRLEWCRGVFAGKQVRKSVFTLNAYVVYVKRCPRESQRLDANSRTGSNRIYCSADVKKGHPGSNDNYEIFTEVFVFLALETMRSCECK